MDLRTIGHFLAPDLVKPPASKEPVRADPSLSFTDFLSYMQFGSVGYNLVGSSTAGQKGENIANSFAGYVEGAYKRNGIVFACMAARQLLFSEARFQFRRRTNGRAGDLFGTPALDVLEHPWTNATTGDLLTRAITDVDLAGNFYAVRRGNEIRRLRPDWVTIILGSKTGSEIDTEVAGYAYQPGGPGGGEDVVVLFPEEVAHFAPIPDPSARFRGMSWLTPIIEEIHADQAATVHKRTFFDAGATLGYVVTLDSDLRQTEFDTWVKKFRAGHEGAANAYKTLFLAAGADIKTVGTDFKGLELKDTQGAGETRICAAARVPPIIVGLSEGLASATYSNYGQARRAFADLTMRPLWRNIAGSLTSIVQVPAGAEIWYDDRDIPFLQEDMTDLAAIQETQSRTIHSLIVAGYEPDSVIKAVISGDLSALAHTGMFSVQLQPAGTVAEGKGSLDAGTVITAPKGNGNGQPALPASTS